jgi:hypothetical protein
MKNMAFWAAISLRSKKKKKKKGERRGNAANRRMCDMGF